MMATAVLVVGLWSGALRNKSKQQPKFYWIEILLSAIYPLFIGVSLIFLISLFFKISEASGNDVLYAWISISAFGGTLLIVFFPIHFLNKKYKKLDSKKD